MPQTVCGPGTGRKPFMSARGARGVVLVLHQKRQISGSRGPEETRALAGQGRGGAVLLLSGQCPVSAFNCLRLSVAPAVHGHQPCTRPTPPPPACRALPGLQPVCSCSSHCVGGGGWGRGSEQGVGGEARPTVPPRHQEL